ncbi:hypothetical protein [Yinghuangia sp. YIM S09857]|uniref:hypothetical protein n=1 Tax=Yinghuangia sp. YIM S09857 TaxID=3436929 RepID=UPI003F52F30F
MTSAGSWYVLVEESKPETEFAGATLDSVTVPRWHLTSRHHIAGGRDQAREAAESLAHTWLPEELKYRGDRGGTVGRSIFRLTGDSWLVEVTSQPWQRHARISLAELIHLVEHVPPPETPEPSPRKRKFFR